jgi:hypothetical protein
VIEEVENYSAETDVHNQTPNVIEGKTLKTVYYSMCMFNIVIFMCSKFVSTFSLFSVFNYVKYYFLIS